VVHRLLFLTERYCGAWKSSDYQNK